MFLHPSIQQEELGYNFISMHAVNEWICFYTQVYNKKSWDIILLSMHAINEWICLPLVPFLYNPK